MGLRLAARGQSEATEGAVNPGLQAVFRAVAASLPPPQI